MTDNRITTEGQRDVCTEEDVIRRFFGCLLTAIVVGSLVFILCMCTSCSSTKTVGLDGYVGEYSSNTVIHDELELISVTRVDSVIVHDSVYVERWRNGDTVFQTKYIERTSYRDRWRTDSVVVMQHDTTKVIRVDTIAVRETVVDKREMRVLATRSVYAGVAVGVLVLGAILFFVRRGKP